MTAKMGRRAWLGAAGAAFAARARAQSVDAPTGPVRIGVLNDETGPYADSGGAGSLAAARMAVADFGPSVLGQPIELLHADTQNKPDIASTIARGWFDQGVDAIVDLPVTPIAAAVQQLAREKTRTAMITAAAVTDFTAKLCAPVSTHWADDTSAMTAGTTRRIVEAGGKRWFFITVDYTFGRTLEAAARAQIEAHGGSVIGGATFPANNHDFASQLVAAQASGADVVGCASVGNDQVNLLKQAAEFGLPARQRMAAFLVYVTDIHAVGLPVAQGLTFASGFYWDQNDGTRAFAERFYKERKAMPTRNQASVYLACRHFLRAMAQAGSRDALAIGRAMRALPVDYFGRPASVRADGRVLYDVGVWRVKRPEESRAEWDLYSSDGTLAAADAFLPIAPACAQG